MRTLAPHQIPLPLVRSSYAFSNPLPSPANVFCEWPLNVYEQNFQIHLRYTSFNNYKKTYSYTAKFPKPQLFTRSSVRVVKRLRHSQLSIISKYYAYPEVSLKLTIQSLTPFTGAYKLIVKIV